MRWIFGLLFFAHAVAHLPGFLVDLRVTTFSELPYRTTILGGRIDLGDAGVRIMGWTWLGLAVTLAVVAVAIVMALPWWRPVAYVALGVSLVMCALALPETREGVFANLLVVTVALLANRLAGTTI